MTKESYAGKDITIHFDGSKCIHSRNCVLKEPGVFLANTPGDWIQPDNAPSHTLVALAHNCPSGAITYDMADGSSAGTAPHVNTIHVRENGPYAVAMDIQIPGEDPLARATLSRCGHSSNKPFCDGTHAKVGFKS